MKRNLKSPLKILTKNSPSDFQGEAAELGSPLSHSTDKHSFVAGQCVWYQEDAADVQAAQVLA